MARALAVLLKSIDCGDAVGTCAPCLIETPIPTRAKGLALLSTSLVPSNGPMAPGGHRRRRTFAGGDAPGQRACGVVLDRNLVGRPASSNSGTSSSATDLKAPAVSSLRSAGGSGSHCRQSASSAIRKARMVFSLGGIAHDVGLQGRIHEGMGRRRHAVLAAELERPLPRRARALDAIAAQEIDGHRRNEARGGALRRS